MRRFLSFFVLLAAGLGAAWSVCHFTTPCYESRCECEVSFGRPLEGGFEETLNTRLAAWQSDLGAALAGVKVARVPRSRLVSVTARGARAEETAARANAAAEALVAFTETTNVSRAETSIAQIHAEVERYREKDERLARDLLARCSASASGGGESALQRLRENLAQTESDINEQERRARDAGEWKGFLDVARTSPASLGAFPASVPEESEVRRAHRAWAAARDQLRNLRGKYTEEHPEVEVAVRLCASREQQLKEVAQGALTVAEGERVAVQDQLRELRRKAGRLHAELEGMDVRIAEANGAIERLRQEKDLVRANYEKLLQKENEMRISAGQDVDHVRVVRAAAVPDKPLYPDSVLIYSIGAGAPLALCILLGLLWPSAPCRRAQFHLHGHSHDHSHHHSHDHSHDHTHHHSHDYAHDPSHDHMHDHTHHHSHDHTHHHSHDHTHHHSHGHSHDHSHGHSPHHSHDHSHHRHHSI